MINIVLTTSILLIGFIIVNRISANKKKHDLIDVFWGMGFVITAITSYFLGQRSQIGLVMTILTIIWGLRLSTHLAARNLNKPEDFRYKEMRERWPNNFERNIFLRIYLLQFALNLIIGFPVIYVNIYGIGEINGLTILGILIWLVGMTFEVVGDAQLKKHLVKNKGKLITTGLWKYTRHPNYFGESTVWWGMYLIALSEKWSNFWLIFSPFIITYLLIYVSGIPLLEEKMSKRDGWEEYSNKTSKFIPMPPKK